MKNFFSKIFNFIKSIFNLNFTDFTWIKTAKFVELENIDVSEDPVRQELDLEWRTTHDRKIYGLEYNNEMQKRGYKIEAAESRMKGSAAYEYGKSSAVGTLLTGASIFL